MPTKDDLNRELNRIIENSWDGNDEDRGIKREFLHLMEQYPVSLDKIREQQYNDNITPTDRQNNNKRDFYRIVKKWVPDYSTPQTRREIDYNLALTDKYYFCRFGYVYALEYATLYQLIFLDMVSALQQNDPKEYISENAYNLNAKRINALALGSGSLIDLFGMCFAKAVLDSNNCPLFMLESYTGYDLCEWKEKFSKDLLSEFFIDNGRTAITEHLNDDGNIINAFGSDKTITQNIIIFPKILNELAENGDIFTVLTDAIRATKFPEDEYYICFSHNKSDTNEEKKEGLGLSKKIVDAISRGMFSIDSDILGITRNDILNILYGDHIRDTLGTVILNDKSIAYSFDKTNGGLNYNNHYDPIFNGDFENLEGDFKFLSYCFDPLITRIKADYDIPDDELRNVASHAAGMLVFQIVKLTRRNIEDIDPFEDLF